MNQDYIDAAIAKLPNPSHDAHYLHQARDLINSGNALQNPIKFDDVGNNLNDLSQMMGNATAGNIEQGNSDQTKRNLIVAQLFGASKEETDDAIRHLGIVKGMSDRMFTSFEPFSDKMDVPSGFGASRNASKMGVPQVNTLLGVASGQQSADAMLGNNPDNPCSSFMQTVTNVIADVKDAIAGAAIFIGDALSEAGQMLSDVASGTASAINSLIDSIAAGVGDIVDWSEQGIAAINAQISSAIGAAGAAVDAVMGDLSTMIGDGISAIAESVSDLVESINDTCDFIVDQAKTALASMLKSLSSLNPCAQDAVMNELTTPDMKTLLEANIPPKGLIM